MRNLFFGAALAALLSTSALADQSWQPIGGATQSGNIIAIASPPASGTVCLQTHGMGSATVTISGTWVATLQLQASTDGSTFSGVRGYPLTGGAPISSTTGNATVGVDLAQPPLQYLCVNASAYTSGTAVVVIETSAAPFPSLFGGQANMAQANTALARMVTLMPDKSVINQPSAATAAVASIAAGGASVRHIATGCSVYISTVAAQPDIVVNLRDGATGAGTIIWTGRVSCAITSGNVCAAWSGPINVIGGANTAMTCETATAPAATNLAVATLHYRDAN